MAFNPSNCTDSFGIEDNFQTTLSSSITDSDTAIPLTALPVPTEGTLVIEPDTANEEEIYYTSQGSGVVNVPSVSAGRGVYGTAVSHNSGVTVKMIPTRAAWEAVKYGGAIEDGSITSAKIGAGEVAATNLATGAITLGYAEVSSNQGSITTEVDLTNLSVTVTVPTGGRKIAIRASILAQSTVAADRALLRIKESTTDLKQMYCTLPVANNVETITDAHIFTPSAGSHTYKLSLQRYSGTGTLTMVAASNAIAYIHVTAL